VATLNTHRKRPTLRPLDFSHLSVVEVMANYHDAKSWLGVDYEAPEKDALSFYLGNSIYAAMTQRFKPDEDLGEFDAFVENYHEVIRKASVRLFFYLMLICTREARHAKITSTLESKLDAAYGCMKFTSATTGKGSTAAANLLIAHAPKVPMFAYTNHLVDVFLQGGFSASFGGPKWAAIAKVLRDFVHGTLSAELLLDTGFSLAHNGGPIFNKGMLYLDYDGYELLKILDVQRAGQIPQLVWSGASTKVTLGHRETCAAAHKAFGESMIGPVDWDRVEELGALQKYEHEKPKVLEPTVFPGKVFINPSMALKKAVEVRS
jgi:hypothetical protein